MNWSQMVIWSEFQLTLLENHDETHTFIFNERSDSLIHLPANAGLMGLTTEEGYLVMQS